MATDNSKTTVAILSIGDMGGGIARLLVARGFRVVTDVTGRSADTISRAQSAGVETLSLSAIVDEAQAILSIVPPSDTKSTAQGVLSALLSSSQTRKDQPPLVYVDLNAVSPASARSLSSLFAPHSSLVSFVDGAIIGGPPSLQESGDWSVPQIPVSGPHPLPPALATALEAYHISQEIGAASGLKMCFASLTKGYTAIAIQAYTTAYRLGVMDYLSEAVDKTIPGMKGRIERGVTGCPPKAYRWVGEMEEISATHAEDGGFGGWVGKSGEERGEHGVEEGGEHGGEGEEGVGEKGERRETRKEKGADMFTGAARTFELVAHGTVLGEEKVGRRKRGLTVEDVARAVAEGLEGLEERQDGGKRRRVEEGGDDRE